MLVLMWAGMCDPRPPAAARHTDQQTAFQTDMVPGSVMLTVLVARQINLLFRIVPWGGVALHCGDHDCCPHLGSRIFLCPGPVAYKGIAPANEWIGRPAAHKSNWLSRKRVVSWNKNWNDKSMLGASKGKWLRSASFQKRSTSAGTG